MKINNGVTRVNKLPKNKNISTSKVTTYGGRNELVEADLYFKLRDENTELKKKITDLEFQNKKQEVSNLKNKNPININTTDIETLKIENENSKNKILKMKQIIQGLQNELKKKNKPFQKGKNYQSSENEKYLKLISELQNQLNKAHNERRILIDDIASIKQSNLSSTLASYSDDLRDNKSKLADLNVKYDKALNSLEVNNKVLELTKKELADYSDKYRIERDKNMEKDNEIEDLKNSLSKVNDYIEEIEEYKKREIEYEKKIQELCEDPYLKQANERELIVIKLKEIEFALNEEQKRLKNANDKIKELEILIKNLQEQNDFLIEERDKFKDDVLKYKLTIEEKEKKYNELGETMKRLSQFGEVESNYQNLINVMKDTKINDNNNSEINQENGPWGDINFLEKMNEEPKDINQLQKENQRLKIEKSILGDELEQTKKLLINQQEINKNIKKVQEMDNEKYKSEIQFLKDKIIELNKIINKEKIPIETINKDETISEISINKEEKEKEKEKEKEINILRSSHRTIDSKITGFSIDSQSEYGENENALDLYITYGTFDREIVESKLNIPLENLSSFLTVDFYLHETQSSNLTIAPRPNYNLQLTFKVIVDEYFINFIQDEYIIIELYSIQDNIQKIIANGKIELYQLIKAEKNHKTRVIHGNIEMFLSSDSKYKLCDIKYKMRMRKSIMNILKWIEEKKQLTKNLSPLNEANMNILDENLKKKEFNNRQLDVIEYYERNKNNRVFVIRILIIRAENLILSFPSRKMYPYIYYNFYRKNEHFSKILSNPNDEFNDLAQFTCIYNNTLHNYLLNNTLDVYIFDSAKPIEVDIGDDVRMIREENDNDLIGICKINLKSLLLTGKIDGKMAILNESLSNTIGNLIINITWEEINKYQEIPINENINITINKEGVDPLLIKLASFLREKGLNINSAFRLFDSYNQNYITIDSFRNILVSIKYTKSDEEILKLVQIIFGNKSMIYEIDFKQIFNDLLPIDKGFYNKNNKIDNSQFDKNNLIESNQDMQFSIDRQYENQNFNNLNNDDMIDTNNNFISNNMNQGNDFNTGFISNYYDQNIIKTRNVKEIMINANNYLNRFGNNNAIDLYKMFDSDGNNFVGKKEMANGFGKLGIELNNEELDNIWNEIVNNDIHAEKFDFEKFKLFYNKHRFDS